MKTLSKTAELHLNSYLRHVRKYLQASDSVDANEVEKDILDHVESELERAEDPVSLSEMNRVLKELGDPGQWISMDDMSWWQQMHFKFKVGTKEHPWAYGILICFLILIVIGRPGIALIPLVLYLCVRKILL